MLQSISCLWQVKAVKGCTARIVPDHSKFRKRNRFVASMQQRPLKRSESLRRCVDLMLTPDLPSEPSEGYKVFRFITG